MNCMKKEQYKKPVTEIVEARLNSLLYEASVPYGGPGDSETPDDAKEFINDMNDDDNDNFWGGNLWED